MRAPAGMNLRPGRFAYARDRRFRRVPFSPKGGGLAGRRGAAFRILHFFHTPVFAA